MRSFHGRRQRLLGLRAGLCMLVVCLLGWALLAGLDRAWLLPEALRPWLGLGVYTAAFYLAWRVAVRHLGRAGEVKENAMLMEAAAPALRERLLAAVELADENSAGSGEFRARLQDEVAGQMEKLNIPALLPLAALKKWLLAGGSVLLLVLALSAVPRLHFPGFLLRAALPFANLARPSTVKIAIVQPDPAEGLVPVASEREIVAEVTGLDAGTVVLETVMDAGAPRQTGMTLSHGRRYAAMVSIGQGNVRYRVLAGDAISPWFTLEARVRPRVVEFVKTIQPPAYSGLPAAVVTEDHGDIEALEGSLVQLRLKPNQKVEKADLLVNPELADHPEAVPMVVEADGSVTGSLTVQAGDEAWLSALTAADTGFTNAESSPARISVLPDLPPVVQILEPQEQISLMADEVLRLSGQAGDDVGLQSVHLAWAVNGAEWEKKELLSKPGREAAVQTALPLGPLQVKPGDAVLVKLLARDLKGQESESAVARVIILEQTVDPQQRQWAQEMRRVAQQAAQLQEQAREMRKAVDQVKKVQKKAAGEPPESAVARAQAALQQVSDRADDLWQQLKETARTAPSALDSQEVELLGKKLIHMRQESLPRMKALMADELENPESLRRAAAEAGADAETVAQASRLFAMEDNARIASQAARQLSRQEALLTEQSLTSNRDSSLRPRWQEQQRAAIAATEGVRQELEAVKTVLEPGQQRQVDDLSKQIAETAADLNASLDKPEQTKSPEHLYGAADNHRQRLGRSADTLRAMAESAADKAAQMRERLGKQENPAIAAMNAARDALGQAAAEVRNPKKQQRLDKENQTAAQRAEKSLAEAARQMEDQAVLREQNGRTNNETALDANRASRAAQQFSREVAALPKAAQEQDAQAVADLQAKAESLTGLARVLETQALTQDAQQSLEEAALSASATASLSEDQAALANNQAKAAEEALRQLPDKLRRLKTPQPEMSASAQQAANFSRQAADHLRALDRHAARQPEQPLSADPARQALAAAGEKTAELAARLAGPAQEARAALAEMTPDVSDMMKAVAQDLKQTQQSTQQAATQAEAAKPVDEVAAQARDLQAQAGENTRQMESLQAALRQEANAADLREEQQRQVARMADVALAQMQQKAPQIDQNLRQAAQAQASEAQAKNLNQAAQAQQQTAEALDQLAENMAKSENGQQLTEQEMAAMQKMEQDLGVEESLEEAYKRAQELAKMAQDASQNPAEVLSALEKELPKNASMQKALAELSKQAAQASEQAVAAEAQQPSNIGLAAEQAAHDLARVARHQQRLGQQEAAQQTVQASNQLQQQSVAAKGQPGQPQTPIGAESQTAAAQAAKAAEASAAATPGVPSSNPFADVQGALLAQALDQLDQTLNPKMGSAGQQQESQAGQQQQEGSGQQQQQQQNQNAAQQSLADAQKSQQQSMADQRNQGQAPGSQQSGQQQQASANNKPSNSDPQQPSNSDGGNQTMQIVEGVLGPDAVLLQGDWGHLPSKMAADLSEATRNEAAPEYRAAIESYYKAIAEKAKK